MVNFLFLVRLKLLNPVKPSALLDHYGYIVSLVQLVGCGEDVGDTIQDSIDSLVILGSKKVTEGLYGQMDTGQSP